MNKTRGHITECHWFLPNSVYVLLWLHLAHFNLNYSDLLIFTLNDCYFIRLHSTKWIHWKGFLKKFPNKAFLQEWSEEQQLWRVPNPRERKVGIKMGVHLFVRWIIGWAWKCLEISIPGLWKWRRSLSTSLFYSTLDCG